MFSYENTLFFTIGSNVTTTVYLLILYRTNTSLRSYPSKPYEFSECVGVNANNKQKKQIKNKKENGYKTKIKHKTYKAQTQR